MSISTTPFLRLPGEDERELWLHDDGGTWRRAPADDKRKGGLFAVEALAMDSAPFWAAAGTDAEVDLEMMSSLHWEALGLTPDPDARHWLHWRAGAEAGRILTATMALAPETAQDEWVSFLPDSFELSARLRPIPPNECALWKEMGRIVVGFNRGDQLLHVAVLNSRVLDADAAREVHDLTLALEVRGFLQAVAGWRIWTGAGEGFVGALEGLVGIKVVVETMPPPVVPQVNSDLLPADVGRRRNEKLQRHNLLRMISTASLALISFFAAWGGWLGWREHHVEHAAASLRVQEPEVQAVRDAQLRWSAAEAATDPDSYPVEVFHQIVSLLPEQGVQFQEFAFDQGQIIFGGVASSVNFALKFRDDLKNHEALKHYTWNFQEPNILDNDNRASFHAEGALNGGTPP